MRATRVLSRGAKGYSWYQNYVKNGNEGFRKNVPPTPFDWSAADATVSRTKVFFDVAIGDAKPGRICFELADDVVPKTVENFKLLCSGDNMHSRGFKGTKFHQVQKGGFLMGGDVEFGDGSGSHSAYKERYIVDENFIIPHSQRGLISMASVGLDTGGSQFYVSLSPTAHMNGRCVVFGRVVEDKEGSDLLAAVEKVFTFRGLPSNDVVIVNCGTLE